MIKPKDYIDEIPPYRPGKSIEEYVRERGLRPIKLASNENPYGPSPIVIEEIGKVINDIHRYPEAGSVKLREELASLLRVSPGNIIVTNGSNEAIELICKLYLSAGDRAIVTYPTFSMYEIFCRIYGADVIKVPMVNFRVDFESLFYHFDDSVKVLFLANPNNPTGTIFFEDDFVRFLDRINGRAIVVVDEAYFDFVGDSRFPDTVELIKKGYPIVSIRTFSKAYGLAGLRVGYALGSEEVISYMHRVRQPFNVNLIAQVAAIYAVRDRDYYDFVRRSIIEERNRLQDSLRNMGVSFIGSEANFVAINVGDADAVYRSLLDRGIIVRSLTSFGMGDYIRVTIGKPEENSAFLSAFREVMGI